MPKKYVSRTYKDFEEENVVWCWDENGKFRKHELKHMVAGDTDSGYFRVPDALDDFDVEEVVETADDMVQYVDQCFPDFLKIAFNCPEERLRSIRTDREVVSDKSFFATKKRYAMHIINDEGKYVDKTKIMGLEIKKSDTSKAVKAFLTKAVDMIIDGCTREELLQARKEFKKEFFGMTITEIGIPKPANKLGQAEETFEQTRSMKGITWHLTGAIYYNQLCSKTDREIYPGEKFYICDIDSNHCKYIGVPMVLNRVPDFVNEININYESMWKKAEKKINNYMKSLGWDIESRMKAQAAGLFGVKG